MEEVISLNGQPFKIWYATPSEKTSAVAQAQQMSKGNVNRLASTCTTATKTVGQTVTLSSTPTEGTPPYTYSFYKMIPGATIPVWLLGSASAGQSLKSYTYTTLTEDITNISGQLKVGVIVFDSCATGVKTSEETCYVNVVAACVAPVANLTVT